MTINTRELIEAVSIVTENANIRVTVKSSVKAGLIVGGSTFLGAVTMGPPGIIIGATAGAIWSYTRAKGTFKSAALVIKDDMTDDQKEQLCGHIVEAFKNFDATDITMIVSMLLTNGPFQTIVLKKVVEFMTNEMRMQIVD